MLASEGYLQTSRVMFEMTNDVGIVFAEGVVLRHCEFVPLSQVAASAHSGVELHARFLLGAAAIEICATITCLKYSSALPSMLIAGTTALWQLIHLSLLFELIKNLEEIVF